MLEICDLLMQLIHGLVSIGPGEKEMHLEHDLNETLWIVSGRAQNSCNTGIHKI